MKQVEDLKALKSEERKQEISSIEGNFPKDMRTNKTRNEINGNKRWEEKIKGQDLKYETKKYTYYFHKYEANRSFGDGIYTHKGNMGEAEKDQRIL